MEYEQMTGLNGKPLQELQPKRIGVPASGLPLKGGAESLVSASAESPYPDGEKLNGGARIGDWMQTFTGKPFWPLDPRPEEICLEDIAHALSHQCRYAGHCNRFYSVAEHSVLIASAMIRDYKDVKANWIRLAAIGLMHDAAEAYLVDLPRPVKRQFPAYEAVERTLFVHIAERFGLAKTFVPDLVKQYDNRILFDEQAQLMAPPPMPWGIQGEPLGVTIKGMAPHEARETFLGMAAILGVA